MPDHLPSVTWDPTTRLLTITHLGRSILEARIDGEVTWEQQSRPAEPVYLGYGHGPEYAGGVPEGRQAQALVVTIRCGSLSGHVTASEDSFACSPGSDGGLIRSFVGSSTNLLNTGVYDRAGDWLVCVEQSEECRVSTGEGGRFDVSASGAKIKLALAVDFYRNHRGYFHWKPGKPLWQEPVSGWCSWAAHAKGVTEQDVIAAADMLAHDLIHYGYNIVQLDDGYQLLKQKDPDVLGAGRRVADLWTNSNEQFAHGMKWLAQQVSDRGLTPGIWIGCWLPLGLPDEWYVKDDQGRPRHGRWVNYAIDGGIPEAVDATFPDAVRGLKQAGWRYFKIDTIRHVIYDNYRTVERYWQDRGIAPEDAFRRLFTAVGDAIGPDIYYLACWGTIPELAGIPDGCRIGEDVGPNMRSLLSVQRFICQFNYLNNILWLNDPDYMCFRLPLEQCKTWATILALTGCQLMISDPPETYDEDRLEILRRVGPPLFTRPAVLDQVQPGAELWLLEIDGPEPYTVLARTAWDEDGLPESIITFAELGLAQGRYLVFDFWNEKFIGEFDAGFPTDALAQGECRVYAVRPALGRPQVLSTNRHISQGAYELENISWHGSTLSGRIKLPPNRSHSVLVHVPEGYAHAPGQANCRLEGRILRVLPDADGEWSVTFSQ